MTIQGFWRVDGKSNYKANPFGDDNQKRKKDYNRNIKRELMRFGLDFFDGGEEERKN
jgi:hypothetical protein